MESVLAGFDQLRADPPEDDAAIRRLVDMVGHEDIATLFAVADLRGVDGVAAVRDRHGDLADREDLSDLSPAATGGDLIAGLELEPGPAVGQAMAALRERRLDDGPATVAEELDWLRRR